MKKYKVSVECVNVYPHPNADLLELVGIGDNQYVVEKGLYKSGDKAVAVPKNSVLTHPILLREWEKYLQGSNKDRVGFIILRNQESEGIVIREDILNLLGFNINSFTVGEDISEVLGISKYIPEIPDDIKDTVEVYNGSLNKSIEHDCKYATVYLDKFKEGQPITITSKLHGSQINIILCHKDNKRTVISSKGLWNTGLVFKEGVDNKYTKAWQNFYNKTSNLFWDALSEQIGASILDQQIQIIGEVIPFIKGFNYGFTEPTLFIYSIYVNGQYMDLNVLRRFTLNIIPLLYNGEFNSSTMQLATDYAEEATCPLDATTLNEGVVISNGKQHIKVKNSRFMKKFGKDESN